MEPVPSRSQSTEAETLNQPTTTPTVNKAAKRAFTLEFKLNVIKCAEQFSNYYAAEKYNVERPNVIVWRKNKEKIGKTSY